MKIGIIGGGASGVMAAIIAARNNESVTIIEHNSRLLKKLLATGNGRCNYTNENMDISHFHGTDAAFISDILSKLDYENTIELFKGLGVYPKNKNGYIYPYCEQALSVAECLIMELDRLNVNIITDCNITRFIYDSPDDIMGSADGFNTINKVNDYVFKVSTDKGSFTFDKLIIATGSCAASKTGSDGSGFDIASSFGIEINKPLPALCSLICEESIYKQVAGVRCSARVSVFVNDELKKSDTGELQLTDYGISGIPVFQISYIAAKALNKKKNVTVVLDFMPELEDGELCKLIIKRINNNPNKTVEEMLVGLLNKKLIHMLIKRIDAVNNVKDKNSVNGYKTVSLSGARAGSLDNQAIFSIVNVIKHFKSLVKSTNTFENAQVCTGGVKLTELKNTLECKKVPGLYFAGEILDVNGDCGGYNLQWAWSSGYVAGQTE